MTELQADPDRSLGLRRLWQAYAISMAGTYVSFGVLPLIAITSLDARAIDVSFLAASTAVCAGVSSLLVAPRLEHSSKRVVLMVCEVAQAVTMIALVGAAVTDSLTMVQVYIASMMEASLFIIYMSATNAVIKMLAEEHEYVAISSKMESASWTAMTLGPPLGGLLVTAFGPTVALAIDGCSYALAALLLRRLPRDGSEGPQACREDPTLQTGRPGFTAGFRHIWSVPTLRSLFINALTFGGAIMLVGPLLAVLMLVDLEMTALHYGLALGVPSLGGLLGALCARRLARALGRHRLLLTAGVIRAPWVLLLAFAPEGATGLLTIVVLQSLTMFGAGLFNPAFSATRLIATPQELIIRVTTAWSVAAKTVQPAMIAAGGIIAALTSVRTAIAAAGVIAALSIIALPWSTAPAKRATAARDAT